MADVPNKGICHFFIMVDIQERTHKKSQCPKCPKSAKPSLYQLTN